MGLFSRLSAYAALSDQKKIFGNNKNYLYIVYHKTERRCIYNVKEKKHKRLYPIKKELFGNNKNYLYICNKKIK